MEIFESIFANLDIRENVPLSSLTSFRIGGPARIVVFPHSEQELEDTMNRIQKHELPWHLMGNGTNILAPDNGYNGVLIVLNKPFTSFRIDGTFIRCSAGDSLAAVSKAAVSSGLMGMEGLSGIPGTVGGACAMNAGAYGSEIKSVLKKVRVMHNTEISDVTVLDSDLATRKSRFTAPDYIVLEAMFELEPDDGNAMERLSDYSNRRKSKQPLELPSAGSVFKRPAGNYAGTLIESCGLKGYRIGGAEVSPKHAGFIVNIGNATEKDVRSLVDTVQKRVFEETGYQLERELKYFEEV